MRYFRLHTGRGGVQPGFGDWYTKIGPSVSEEKTYGKLEGKTYWKVKLDNPETAFMDVLTKPCFMVSKELSNLIRLYCPGMEFKYIALFDEKNGRIGSYFIPNLPEVDCLDEGSEFDWTRTRIVKGALREEKIKGQHIFRLKWEKERCIIADLDFVESAFRREVRGMEIEEYMVR